MSIHKNINEPGSEWDGLESLQPGLEPVQPGLQPVQPGLQLDDARYQRSQTIQRSPTVNIANTDLTAVNTVTDNSSSLDDIEKSPKRYSIRPMTLWISLAIGFLLVLVVGLGAGLGVSRSRSQSGSTPTTSKTTVPSNSNVTTATPTNTSAANFRVPTAGVLPLDCPALDNRTYTNTVEKMTFNYLMRCDLIYSQNRYFVGFPAYSLDACVGACSFMNVKQGRMACTGITFAADLRRIDVLHGNCFLKNDTGPLLSQALEEHWVAGILQTTQSIG